MAMKIFNLNVECAALTRKSPKSDANAKPSGKKADALQSFHDNAVLALAGSLKKHLAGLNSYAPFPLAAAQDHEVPD